MRPRASITKMFLIPISNRLYNSEKHIHLNSSNFQKIGITFELPSLMESANDPPTAPLPQEIDAVPFLKKQFKEIQSCSSTRTSCGLISCPSVGVFFLL